MTYHNLKTTIEATGTDSLDFYNDNL